MGNNFIVWWFDTHYIWSTLLTPMMTLAWCIFTDQGARGLVAFILTCPSIVGLVLGLCGSILTVFK